jgi:hypothetical protein
LQAYVWCFEYSIIIYNNHDSLKGVKAPAIDDWRGCFYRVDPLDCLFPPSYSTRSSSISSTLTNSNRLTIYRWCWGHQHCISSPSIWSGIWACLCPRFSTLCWNIIREA